MEGKCYDGIVRGTPVFSPDRQRVAYGARTANRLSVVVDGKEGKRYAGLGVGVPRLRQSCRRRFHEKIAFNQIGHWFIRSSFYLGSCRLQLEMAN